MGEMDLVPSDYRRSLRLRRSFRVFVIVQLVLMLALFAARLTLDYGIRSKHREIEELQVAEDMAGLRRSQLDALEQEHQVARRRLSILAGLQGGVSSDQVFLAMDRALGADIWFLDWKFIRAGELIDEDPKAVQAGYFLVVPLEEPDQPNKAWRLETHMEVRGLALNHSSLAQFVDRLVDEPRVQQVRIVNTRVRSDSAAVVDFDLVVVVRSDA